MINAELVGGNYNFLWTWPHDVKPFQVELISLSSQKWLRFISALMTTRTSVMSHVELCLCLPAVNQSQTKVMQPVLCVWSVLYNESTKVLTQKEKSTLICIPVLASARDFQWGRKLWREKTKGSKAVGELILPWSAPLYSNKEPSRLPGIWDVSPLGDGEEYGGREGASQRVILTLITVSLREGRMRVRKWYDRWCLAVS